MLTLLLPDYRCCDGLGALKLWCVACGSGADRLRSAIGHPFSARLPPPAGEDYPCGGRLLLFEVVRGGGEAEGDASGSVQWAGRLIYTR